jgi:hypothetical protein
MKGRIQSCVTFAVPGPFATTVPQKKGMQRQVSPHPADKVVAKVYLLLPFERIASSRSRRSAILRSLL